jgi:hypothetical protein
MGKGLSEQQKLILSLALKNRAAENKSKPSNGVDLYECEVLETNPLFARNTIGSLRDSNGKIQGGQHFYKSRIGIYEYNAACASVSRSFRRLEERGLVTRLEGAVSWWAGISLTEAGIAKATELTDTRD